MATKKASEVRSIALIHIKQDPRLQLRVELDDAEYVRSMADILEAGGELSGDLPVVFCEDGNNWLADGNQRYEAHKLAGLKKIKCMVRPGGFREAWCFAMGANAEHGKKRSNADKRNVVEQAFIDEEWKALSDAVIAERCKVSAEFVRKIRKELTPNVGSGIKTNIRTGMDGRTIDTANIGHKPEEPLTEGVSTLETKIRERIATDPAEDDRAIAALLHTTAAQVEMVRSDVIREEIIQAEEKAKEKWQAEPDEPEPPAVAEAEEKPDAVPTDYKKKPLPPDLHAAFIRAGEIHAISKELTQLVNQMKGFRSDGIGSRWLDVRTFENAIKDAQATAKMGAPYIVCCECGGKKKNVGVECKLCKGEGWLPRNAWANLTRDQQNAASVWEDDTK